LQRAVANGVLESAGATFLLLIAVRWFHAGATAKALVASGGSAGLLLTPAVVSLVARWQWPVARAAAWLARVGAVVFLVMAAVPWLPLYVAGSLVTMAAASAAVPLLTQIYQENYPESRRGKLFSHAVMLRLGTVVVFSHLAGQWLSAGMGRFRWLLVGFAGAFAFASWCLRRYPSRPLAKDGGSNPFQALRFLREDRLFRHTLICWMLMGFANLMMLPMRIEYLANPRHGLTLSVNEIALLASVVPNLARLLMSQVWGWLFDRMNFFLLRIVLNAGFAAGILTFFTSDSLTGLMAGAVIFGISNAGGDVAWGLWVTKFSPPKHVAQYMSVHAFFSGVRGVCAPLLAFHLSVGASLARLGWTATALIFVASAMLLPEVRFRREIRRGAALTEDVSD
jgi:MFS family permease